MAQQQEVWRRATCRRCPRTLSLSRAICKAWRDVIDDRQLLRPELLLRTLGGMFINFNMLARPEFFSASCEVFLMPVVAQWARLDNAAMARSEWPPSLCETHVFSSRTGRWEERSFVREGEPAGTVAAMTKPFTMEKRYSVYWRGALYVHCQNDFICRVSMADSKYRVIKLPTENEPDDEDRQEPYLGRSEKGVYCAVLVRGFRLPVWILDESSSGEMEWVLRHQSNLERVLASQDSYQRDDDGACWCFKDINHYANYPEDDGDEELNKTEHTYLTLLGLHSSFQGGCVPEQRNEYWTGL